MYADQLEAEANRSVRDRLNGNNGFDSGRRRPISGKRQREDDDKWEHDLFEDNEPHSNRRIGAKDLRLKLQRKSTEQATPSLRGSVSRGSRDLPQKLSRTLYANATESKPSLARPKPASEIGKPQRKSVIAQAPLPETKPTSSVSKKKVHQVDSVDSFLQSLGLEKYSITFQAEEVDMTALVHMSDEDLKAMGIPMGPRKKILSGIQGKVDD